MRLTLALSATLLAACASAPPGTRDRLSQPETWSPGAEETYYPARARELILRAFALVGTPYRYGGQSPETGFDCSGLIYYVFNRELGLALPRNTQEISRAGEAVGRNDLRPGDLVFFDTLRRPFSHVGIYVGEQRFIHAPSTGGQVEIVNMGSRYWQNRYNGARRISL